ncbi:MAG: hypothetical protein IPI02_20795 [Sterolibacteriaceae bacterium]|nr:hypothetical protein [Sterolibacteriaceae bacterium]
MMLLLDGLYPNGPVLERCRDYHWQFMIVLKDDSLPTVWTEYGALLKFKPDNEHRQSWGERAQHFRWVNDIRYEYGPNHRHHRDVHVVLCRENWQALDEDGEIVTKTAKHAWISSQKLRRENVHQRCNLAARHRWGIEAATWSKAPRLPLRASLRQELERDARLSLPDASRAPAQHPGTLLERAGRAASGDRCARLHTIRAQHL